VRLTRTQRRTTKACFRELCFLSASRLKRKNCGRRSPAEADLVFVFRQLRFRAVVNIARHIRYFEEDDDLPAAFALESATVFLHWLDAYRAQRCHWVRGTPETASGSRTRRQIEARWNRATHGNRGNRHPRQPLRAQTPGIKTFYDVTRRHFWLPCGGRGTDFLRDLEQRDGRGFCPRLHFGRWNG
jgi:hypothetical protein